MSIGVYCHHCGTVQARGHRHRAPDRRPNSRQRGYDAKWRETRDGFLRYFPICQHPDGCLSEATQVHHIDGEGPLGARGHDWGNLQSLCASHHSSMTSVMQPGGWNR